MTAEENRLKLQVEGEKFKQDRENIIKLYKAIQSISTQIPAFHNIEIDKTANTILESIKLMESWLVKECQTHYPNK